MGGFCVKSTAQDTRAQHDPLPPGVGFRSEAASATEVVVGNAPLGLELQAQKGALRPIPGEQGQRSGWKVEQKNNLPLESYFVQIIMDAHGSTAKNNEN